jgi:hypothetical protein
MLMAPFSSNDFRFELNNPARTGNGNKVHFTGYNGGSEAMTIDIPNQRVGIGTSPSCKFHIAENSNSGPEMRLQNTKYTANAQPSSGDDMGILTFYATDRTSNVCEGGRIWTEFNGDPTALTAWYSRMSFGIRDRNSLSPDNNPVLNIVSSSGNAGNVGVGTVSPRKKFEVIPPRKRLCLSCSYARNRRVLRHSFWLP